MENVNRLLLENVLPAHVAAHFIGDKAAEVWKDRVFPESVRRAALCWQSPGYSEVPLRDHGCKGRLALMAQVYGHRGCGQDAWPPWP